MKTHIIIYSQSPSIFFYLFFLLLGSFLLFIVWKMIPSIPLKWIFTGIILLMNGSFIGYGWYCAQNKTIFAIIEENGININKENSLLPYEAIAQIQLQDEFHWKYLQIKTMHVTTKYPINGRMSFSFPVNHKIYAEILSIIQQLKIESSAAKRNEWLNTYETKHLEKLSFHISTE